MRSLKLENNATDRGNPSPEKIISTQILNVTTEVDPESFFILTRKKPRLQPVQAEE